MATSRAGHRRYREQRARMLRKARQEDAPCCFCGGTIDYDLVYPDPWSPAADHSHPVSKGGREFGPTVVLRPAHLRCNNSAGNRHYEQTTTVTTVTTTTVSTYTSKSVRMPTPPTA